jgi:RNA polymerase sigma factor for flagellar operon FliA
MKRMNYAQVGEAMMPAEVAYKTSAAVLDDRNVLVMQELSQVYYIASRLRERLPPHVELEDLVNAGVIGLLEASRSFDCTKNPSFKGFAKFRIRGAILDSLRESDWGSR